MDEAGLKGIPLFDELSSRERRDIAQHADELDLNEGATLVRQGDFSYEFFVIREGSAKVERDGEHVAELGPGDFLGEMGIVSGGARNASVTATSPMRVIVMSEQDLRSASRTHPEVAEKIRNAVAERMAALD
jgi:CRP/FNR family transcriptional regulator, cyclic AMP receptor protein